MAPIPDFTDTELWSLRTVLKERYGKDVELQLADAELRLDPDSTTLTTCPTAERGANFVIFKVGENRYRCQFFYSRREQSAPAARCTTTSPNAPPCCCRSRPTTNVIRRCARKRIATLNLQP